MRKLTRFEDVFLRVVMAASLGAIFWFVRYTPKPHGFLEAAGEFCALMCVLGLFVFALAVRCAEMARDYHWSPEQCRWRPVLPAVAILCFCALKLSLLWVTAPLFVSTGALAGTLCRRLAYPNADAERSYDDEQQLHLVSK